MHIQQTKLSILRKLSMLLVPVFAVAGLAMAVTSSYAASSFSNGFETDTSGWYTDGATIHRVASGSIPAASGNYYADVNTGAYTQWGGYESTFPAGGYTTSLDVYLDMSKNPSVGTDKRFDYTSAVSNSSGGFLRDFVFNVGTDPAAAGKFAISASNNANGWPTNPGRNPIRVDQTGWYTFKHTFENDNGVLKATLSVLDHSGNTLGSWVLSDASDLIGTNVGGNRYGWFPTNGFGTLAIDNSSLSQPDTAAPDVSITNPLDGSTVSGTVDVRGTVTDANPDHYYLKISGPTGTVYSHTYPETNSLTNASLYSWDTTQVADGTYTIRLEARDASGNKDAGSVDTVTVTVNNIPDNKDQCKDNGWSTFANMNFKNQGACVSYVNHNDGVGADDTHARGRH